MQKHTWLYPTLLALLFAATPLRAEPIRKIQVVVSKGGSVYLASILYKVGFTLGGVMEDSRAVEYAGERDLGNRKYHVFTTGRGGYEYFLVSMPGEGGGLATYMTLNMPASRIFKDGVEVGLRDYVLENGKKEEYLQRLRETSGENEAFAIETEPVLIRSFKDLDEVTSTDDIEDFDADDSGRSAFQADVIVQVDRPNYIDHLENPVLRRDWLEDNEDYVKKVEIQSYASRINGQIVFYGLVIDGGERIGRLSRYDFGPYVVYTTSGDPNTGANPVAISIGSMSPEEYQLVETTGDMFGRWGGNVLSSGRSLFGVGED